MGARAGALCVPTAARIEFAQIGEQAMGRCIEVRGLLCDALSQELDFTVRGECIADDSDIE